MKTLISPVSVAEARQAIEGGADIVDVKNVEEGSLGASFPWTIRSIVAMRGSSDVTFSATLGDLPFKPGTASLAALGAAASGAEYVKAGLYGVNTYDEALEMMVAVERACHDFDAKIRVVAAGYADYRRIDGLDTATLLEVAADAKVSTVMIDTAIKDGSGLFDVLSFAEVEQFVAGARERGLEVALAGSIGMDDFPVLRRLRPDIVGVRGCVCHARDRTAGIDAALVTQFVRRARDVQ